MLRRALLVVLALVSVLEALWAMQQWRLSARYRAEYDHLATHPLWQGPVRLDTGEPATMTIDPPGFTPHGLLVELTTEPRVSLWEPPAFHPPSAFITIEGENTTAFFSEPELGEIRSQPELWAKRHPTDASRPVSVADVYLIPDAPLTLTLTSAPPDPRFEGTTQTLTVWAFLCGCELVPILVTKHLAIIAAVVSVLTGVPPLWFVARRWTRRPAPSPAA